MESRSKKTKRNTVEYAHAAEGRQSDMMAMMSRLLRQQAAPDIDINVFTVDSIGYHYLIAVFN